MSCPCPGPKCQLDADDSRHGSLHGYKNLRCRCDPCTAENTAYSAVQAERRRTRKLEATARLADVEREVNAAILRAARIPNPALRTQVREILAPIHRATRTKDAA